MYVLELRDLNKSIKGKTVLQNVSLQIQAGKIYGLVGANGSGKTMLLRAMAGFLNIAPSMRIVPYNLTIGVIIENPAFLEDLTGIENLVYLANLNRKLSLDQIQAAMKKSCLDPDDSRLVKEYSLGMRQKLAIAQAVMEKPNLLLLDEPTRGMDSDSIYSIRKLLIEERLRGAAIVIASHSSNEIELLCDEVFFVDEGYVHAVHR